MRDLARHYLRSDITLSRGVPYQCVCAMSVSSLVHVTMCVEGLFMSHKVLLLLSAQKFMQSCRNYKYWISRGGHVEVTWDISHVIEWGAVIDDNFWY